LARQGTRDARLRVAAISGVLLLLVVATVLAIILTLANKKDSPPPAGPTKQGAVPTRPEGAFEGGGILLGRDLVPGGDAPAADEAVTVEIVSDFLCPWCALMEEAHGQQLAAKARAGEIRLVIHPVNNAVLADINDHYSWRSMLAADTVAALEPDKFWAFQAALWANQPKESKTSGDLTDQAIADLAKEAGVSQATIDRLIDSPVAEWARWSSDQGQGGTPVTYMSFAGSERVVWSGWLLSGTNADGEEQFVAGDLDKAIANVKDGKAPDAE
jgi:protein-disulfide isomerase